jgi:galactonate dehydratase
VVKEFDATPGTYHLVKMFGQRLKGRSPLNVHRLFEDLRKGGFFEGAQSGMYVAVLSAVESALWDLAGKIFRTSRLSIIRGKIQR